jgi:large subunit ribosomal protein L10e
MGLRPARCYRELKRAYTRVSKRVLSKNYIKAAPQHHRIQRFILGDVKADYEKVAYIIAVEKVNIRDRALEACRQKIVKALNPIRGKFCLILRVYPHHILRENKMATGAGADRISQGMSHAFGKPIGRAARIKRPTVLYEIRYNGNAEDLIKKAFNKIKPKLPCDIKLEFKKLKE